ncbi:MAG: hypothetical protein ACFFDS_02830 [Candidatus Thorarchaeota archaeon]
MQKTKNTLLPMIILLVIGISFLPMFGVINANSNSDLYPDPPSVMNNAPISPFNNIELNSIANYTYGFNATASFNRSINFEQFGVVTLIDSIELNVIGNESLVSLNYTLPNINVDNITFIGFHVINETFQDIYLKNATRNYNYIKSDDYTTYIIPFNVDKSSIGKDAHYYFVSYIEFATPYFYKILSGEQLLHYRELLYPLINNIPVVEGETEVNKQGNDNFVDNEEYTVTPNNDTADVIYVSQAASGVLKWTNITRAPFNYSQSYEDDLLMNIYTQSVSTGEAVEEATNVKLFKALEVRRKIEIDPLGLIKVTETQHLVFLGPERPSDSPLTSIKLFGLNAFVVILPQNSSVLSLSDKLGQLNLYEQLDDQGYFERGSYNIRDTIFPNHQGLIIFPRYPLFHGDEMTFTIVYKVQMETFLSKEQASISYKLTLPPCSIINWTVDNLYLDVVLPKGAVYKSYTYESADPYQIIPLTGYEVKFTFSSLGFKRILHFETTKFSGSDNSPMIIYYNYSGFNMWVTYFFQVISVGVIFAIYLGIRWSTKTAKEYVLEEEKEFIPVDEIEEFVKQYEEVLSLKERIRETRAKIAAKKLKAKEGKDLRTKLEKRLRSEEESLKITKENLVKHGGRYKDSVQKIEISERKLFEERRNLRALQQEYRVKKSMTKESYIKLFRERQQTIEKLKNEIDAVLVTLRMLLEP